MKPEEGAEHIDPLGLQKSEASLSLCGVGRLGSSIYIDSVGAGGKQEGSHRPFDSKHSGGRCYVPISQMRVLTF